GRKKFARARRGFGVDLFVGLHAAFGNMAASGQIGHQCVQAFHLLLARFGHFKIAYETDADRLFVHAVAGEVSTLDLPLPAVADFNFTVRHTAAVADHKMIGKAVLHAAFLAVVHIHALQRTVGGGAVVDDDVL